MTLEIQPYEGIGKLKLGMSRKSIMEMLGDSGYSEFHRVPGVGRPVSAFVNLGVFTYFDEHDFCEAIEVFEPANPQFQSIQLLKPPFIELLKFFVDLDANLEVDSSGFTSYLLGIGCYAHFCDEEPDTIPEAIIVFKKTYYK